MSVSNVGATKTAEELVNRDMVPLLINHAIGKVADELVKRAEDLGKEYNIKEKSVGLKSPLRNVLNVATAPDTSKQVVNNFILYQAGRNASHLWKKEPNKKSFAEGLVEEINKLDNLAANIKEDVFKSSESQYTLTDEEMRQLNIKIMKLFLGYLNRYHIATSAGSR